VRRLAGFGPLFEMIENPSDDDRAFDTCDHLDSAAALLSGFDIDLEDVSSPRAAVEAFLP
jgi:hypothetical protein